LEQSKSILACAAPISNKISTYVHVPLFCRSHKKKKKNIFDEARERGRLSEVGCLPGSAALLTPTIERAAVSRGVQCVASTGTID
jgi:hypothetical protein